MTASSTLTDTGRTLAVINLGQGRSAAFLGYRNDRPMAELAEGPATVLDSWRRGRSSCSATPPGA